MECIAERKQASQKSMEEEIGKLNTTGKVNLKGKDSNTIVSWFYILAKEDANQ